MTRLLTKVSESGLAMLLQIEQRFSALPPKRHVKKMLPDHCLNNLWQLGLGNDLTFTELAGRTQCTSDHMHESLLTAYCEGIRRLE